MWEPHNFSPSIKGAAYSLYLLRVSTSLYRTLQNSAELCRNNNISHIYYIYIIYPWKEGYSFHGWFIATKIHNDEKSVSQLLCLCSKFVYQRIESTSGVLPSEEDLIFERFPVKESVEGQTIQKRTLDGGKNAFNDLITQHLTENIWMLCNLQARALLSTL